MWGIDKLKGLFSRLRHSEEKERTELRRDAWGRLINADDVYVIPNNREFEEAVMRELVTDPKRNQELHEQEWKESTERFRAFLKKKQDEERR
jgi:hypothetical protein